MCHVRQGGSMRLAHPAGEGQVTCAAACCTVTVLTSTVLPMIATEKFGLRVSCMRLHKPPRQPAVFSAKSWSKTYYIASFPVTKLKQTKLKFVFCCFFFFFGFQSTSVQLCNSISQQSITQASHLAPNAKKKKKKSVVRSTYSKSALFSQLLAGDLPSLSHTSLSSGLSSPSSSLSETVTITITITMQ